MKVNNQILSNLREDKEDWYYLCNDAEQALFKVKSQCKDERAIKSLERMILELNNIRMEQYKAVTEYSLIEDESSDNDFETPNTTVSIYQIKDVANTDYAFRGYDEVADNVDLADYDKVATIDLPDTDNILDMVFMYGNTDKSKFNEIKPMRSISVSDIIDYDDTMYYVDSFGFKEL